MHLKFKILLIIFLYFVSATILINFFYYKNWDDSIFNLGFCFGDVIEGILKRHTFEGKFIESNPIIFRAHRLPAIPYFIAAISFITGSEKILIITLVKNIIFGFLWVPIIYDGILNLKVSDKFKIVTIFILFSFPQLIIRTVQIELEEAYVVPLLAYFWILLMKKSKFSKIENLAFIVLPSLLLFSRNIFLYIIPILLLIVLINSRDKIKTIALSLFLLISSAFSLAYFNKINTGKFTLSYSLEWINIYKGYNEKTSEIYPKYSLDILDYNDFYNMPPNLKDEWEFNEFFKKKTVDFIKNNQIESAKLLIPKFITTWIDIRPNSIFPGEEYKLKSLEKLIGIFYMLVFRIIQWFCIGYFFIKIFKKPWKEVDSIGFNFLFLIGLYFAPYTIAYGSERHLMPMVIPVFLTFLKIVEGEKYSPKPFN